MSRIGKLPVQIPTGVTITVDQQNVMVNGPKGTLSQPLLSDVSVTVNDQQVEVKRNNDEKIARAQHGLMRALINNMVQGVTQGFEKKLEVQGVGFKVSLQGNKLVMALGFSHEVTFEAPEGVTLAVDKMSITISGIDKQLVGQVAADIRELKKPEPYKGKGIRYSDEYVIRKSGKTGAK
jgi:large subunit ribosomal protein L6